MSERQFELLLHEPEIVAWLDEYRPPPDEAQEDESEYEDWEDEPPRAA